MRVTHVITRLIVGGAQENTIASVLGLRAVPNLEADLIAGPTSGPEGSLESTLAPTPGVLRIAHHLIRPVHPWHDLLAWRELTRLFRERRPDLVHTHSGKAGVLGRLAARRAGVPLIIHTIHGPSFGPFQSGLANAIFLAAERRAARCTTHFVAVANAMTHQYLSVGIGQANQFTRIFSGFPLSPFLHTANDPAVRARFRLAPDHFVVGKIARLAPLKGHKDLFAVAPELIRLCPRLRFLLIGDGRLRGEFEERVRALGLADYFRFTGLVSPGEIPALTGIMDVLVHLSAREGLPRALPQALAAGRPVVARDSDGANEVCLDDQTGFLIPPNDGAALIARLRQLAEDPALGPRLGRRGRQLVQQHFSVERMIEELRALYLRLASPTGFSAT